MCRSQILELGKCSYPQYQLLNQRLNRKMVSHFMPYEDGRGMMKWVISFTLV